MSDIVRQRAVLLAVTLSSFLTPFMGSSINIALPGIGAEFGVDAVTLGWISLSFLLTSAMFLVPFGRVADIYGRHMIFKAGVWSFTVSALACGLSPSVRVLLVVRLIQGAGSAMIFATALPVLISAYPHEKRGHVIGINAASVYLGLSLGPFIGGIFTHYLGWRSIFLMASIMGLFVITCVRRHLPEDVPAGEGQTFDYTGAVLYSSALVSIMYGFSRFPSTTGIIITLCGIAGFVIFVIHEGHVRQPVLHVELFRNNTVFALSNLSALINYSATFSVTFLLSLYLQYIKALDAWHAGMLLVIQPALMALFSPVAGRLSDRIEPRIVSSAGMVLTTAGLLILCFVNQATSLWLIVFSLVILGTGFSMFASPNTNAVMSSVEAKYYGIASGTLGTMRLVGQMMSMGLTMMIFSLFIGHSAITPERHAAFIHSVNVAFAIFTVMCFAGIWMSLARGKVR